MAAKQELEEQLVELEEALCFLEGRLAQREQKSLVTSAKPTRVEQLYELLKFGQHYSIPQIAKHLGVTDKNASTVLCHLKKAGHAIATDSIGRKFIEQ